jgi:hypothetical protein
MEEIMDIQLDKYVKIIIQIEKDFLNENFEENLEKVIEIDKKYYSKFLEKTKCIDIINSYKAREIRKSEIKNVQILTNGNPEIVLMLCLEAIRNNVSMLISIDDFCLAQDTFIVEKINKILKSQNSEIQISLDNLTSKEVLINNSKIFNKTISVGDCNRYNELLDEIENIELYPYGILSLYSDSNEFDDLKKTLYNYASLNGYILDIYDMEMNFDDVIKLMNNDSYKFASILLSKDAEKCKRFKNEVNSKYVFINENPFNKIKFKLDL